MSTPNQTVLPLSIERETRSKRRYRQDHCHTRSGLNHTCGQGRLSPQGDRRPARLASAGDGDAHTPATRCGVQGWMPDDLRTLIERKANLHHSYGYQAQSGIPVITVHKRQEPTIFAMSWSCGEQAFRVKTPYKARLLYNAITRAEANCAVFVQTQQLLSQTTVSGRSRLNVGCPGRQHYRLQG